ncbi:MAG: hypothetical protein AB1894_21110 [Chloroflexota bacterium]
MKILKYLDPIILVGTIVSICVSLVLFITGVDSVDSLIFAMLGIAISLLIDLISRNTQLHDSVLSTIWVNRTLAKDKWFQEHFMEIVQSWERLSNSNYHPLFHQYAKLHMQSIHDQLRQISSGEMTVVASDFRVLSVLLENAKTTLRATSMVSKDFWVSPAGQNYWQKNIEALERGVAITRVFIYDKAEISIPEFKEFMEQMHQKGVRVFIANREDVPPDLCRDFVVADENLVVSATLVGDDQPGEHHISSKPEDILKALSNFDRILWLAKDYQRYFAEIAPTQANQNLEQPTQQP